MEEMNQNDKTNSKDTQKSSNYVSEFAHLYKNTRKIASQQERRELLLNEQKQQRHNCVDSRRDFSELFLGDDDFDLGAKSEPLENMDVNNCNTQRKVSKYHFMKSEWFCEVPDDLEENWFVKFVPEGFRVLVIAKKNNTVLVSAKGRVLSVKTHLPGGGFDKKSSLTVLDCIYNKATKTIFILDCLYWNKMSLLDAETSFRFYWLKNKFDENPQLIKTVTPYRFCVLDFFPAQKHLIQDVMFEILTVDDVQVLYEGVVFYHKELHYIFGETPLLGWLFSYMLPEKLGIDVLPENMAKMPENYECLEQYLKVIKQQTKVRKTWKEVRMEKKQIMDTS